MNIDRPDSPSATTVAPTSIRRSTSIETKRSRPASERPPKKGVARKNAFRSYELTAIKLIYYRFQWRQAGQARPFADRRFWQADRPDGPTIKPGRELPVHGITVGIEHSLSTICDRYHMS
jgi:hypothetical protein